MKVLAIIPARGGSKGVPGKNLREVGGVALVARAVSAAVSAGQIDRVIVSTDDEGIAAAARAAGGEVVMRPAELSGDTASSESALFHVLDQVEAGTAGEASAPGIVVFLQATSPFIDPARLDEAVTLVRSGAADSAFSAVETYEFLWRIDADPAIGAVGVNHDAASRPRRQDREPHYRETGAFYVMDAAGFRAAGHRFFGRVQAVLVDELHGIEIDSPGELDAARALAPLADATMSQHHTPPLTHTPSHHPVSPSTEEQSWPL